MGHSYRRVENTVADCSRWNESEFVRYCQNELSVEDQDKLVAHLEACAECRERFTFCIEVILAERSAQENEADNKILSSPFWNKCKNDIVRQLFGTSRFQHRSKGILAVAAMLFFTLLPLVFAYILFFKPNRDANLGAAKAIISESNRLIVAEALESADRRLRLNPQDAYALFERAASFERLYLLDDAKDDYLSILKYETDKELRIQAEHRLQFIYLHSSIASNAGPSRYRLLDDAIDGYLAGLEKGDWNAAYRAISKAEDIANDMEDLNGEKFGQDLVEFYRSIKADAAGSLIEARRLRFEVENAKSHEKFKELLDKAYQAKTIFNRLGSGCDMERMDVSIAKFLNKLGFYDQSLQIAEAGIESASNSKRLFLRAQFLFRKAENLDETSRFVEARKALEESIETAKKLDIPEFSVRPLMRLANLYFLMTENELAFNQTIDNMFAAQSDNRQAFRIQSMQILGFSAFSLNFPTLSEICLRRSIMLAEKEKNPARIAQGHTFAGIIYAEQKRFNDAEYHFARANSVIDEIGDEASRKLRKLDVTGYQARAEMLAGKTDRAIKLYSDALLLSKELNTQQNLILSQLHQGLGESLMARGDFKRAEAELSLSAKLDKDARSQFEHNNILLTFASTRRTPQEQIDYLKSSPNPFQIKHRR